MSLKAAGAQSHCDVHYRWQQKIDLASLSVASATTTVAQMLTWSAPDIWASNANWCTGRNPREQRVYQVTAWVRHYEVQSGETGDGDWHIELTGSKTADVKNCIVVEIPPAELDSAYWFARQDFLRIITAAGSKANNSGDILPPARVTFKRLAFFDGEHRGAQGTDNLPHQHGRCNSKVSALWEIHPVYSVTAP